MTHDAPLDCAVEVRNRRLHILGTGGEDGGPRDDGLRPAPDDKAAVISMLEPFDPLLPKQCAVTLGLAAQPLQELWPLDAWRIAWAVVGARDPQRPAAPIVEHDHIAQIASQGTPPP